MDLKELYKMQEELDNYIMANSFTVGFEHKDLLIERLLALQTEVSELANATRCFKYWSRKGSADRETLLEEHSDILFFWLSVGLALGFTAEEMEQAYLKKYQINIDRQKNGY